MNARVLSIINGYLYLQYNNDLIKSLEKLFLTDTFSGPYLKSINDIHFDNIYLATYKSNIKGRVIIKYCVDMTKVGI